MKEVLVALAPTVVGPRDHPLAGVGPEDGEVVGAAVVVVVLELPGEFARLAG